MHSEKPVLIIGGGVVGLSVGWELARRGAAVHLFERGRCGRGTSWLAAGMLAPDAEITFEEVELYRLGRESRSRWPDFVRRLEADSGKSVDYRTEGTLLVADDRDSAEALKRNFRFQQKHGCDVRWLPADEALEQEPFLAPRLSAAVFAPEDHQVDNRRLLEALKCAFSEQGGQLHENVEVSAVGTDGQHPTVKTSDGDAVEGHAVVVAAGVDVNQIDGLAGAPRIRPVKGQMIELKRKRPFNLQHVIRGPDAYVVPKSDGRILVGATNEEMGRDRTVTGGGLFELLEGAWEIVPGIFDLPVTDTWAGLRPASLDNAPVLGEGEAPGIIYALGHYRHGILLSPVTAEETAKLILDGETSEWIEPFAQARFYSG